MGVLDDAIREHLELKRKHGASELEVEQQAQEALGPARGVPAESVAAETAVDPAAGPEPNESEADLGIEVEQLPDDEAPPEQVADAPLPAEDAGEEDVLEETPDFLQETPEHDRLWFEQKPPRDFDFDDE